MPCNHYLPQAPEATYTHAHMRTHVLSCLFPIPTILSFNFCQHGKKNRGAAIIFFYPLICLRQVQIDFQFALVGMKLLASNFCLVGLFERKPCYRACLHIYLAKRYLMTWQNDPRYLWFLTFPNILVDF